MRTGGFLYSAQGCAASREGGFYSIQFDAGFGVLAEGKGDILGISAMVWIWPQQKYRKTPGNLEAKAWAQFGRVYFDNDSNVKEILVKSYHFYFL